MIFSTFGWKRMEKEAPGKNTVWGLQLSNVNGWISSWALIFSSLRMSLLMSIVFLCSTIADCVSVQKELKGRNIEMMFSDGKVFHLISYSVSLAATQDTCSGVSSASSSIPVSFTSGLDTLSLYPNLSFSWNCSSTLVFRWKKKLLNAKQYFLHSTLCCLQKT